MRGHVVRALAPLLLLLAAPSEARAAGAGPFNRPAALALDSSGNIYVADTYNDRVVVLAPDGLTLAAWGTWGSAAGEFKYPDGIAVDGAGDVYVSDGSNHRVQKFTPEGKYLTQWGSYGTGNGQFRYPRGLALDAHGRVYVADALNNRIEVFTQAGEFLAKWESSAVYEFGGPYVWPTPLNEPWAIAVDGERAYVSSTAGIHVFATDGSLLGAWGPPWFTDKGVFALRSPTTLAVDDTGAVYVGTAPIASWAKDLSPRVHRFTSSGALLATWGRLGQGDGEFGGDIPKTTSCLKGLVADRAGHLYVADTKNSRIQKFTITGTFLAAWSAGR